MQTKNRLLCIRQSVFYSLHSNTPYTPSSSPATSTPHLLLLHPTTTPAPPHPAPLAAPCYVKFPLYPATRCRFSFLYGNPTCFRTKWYKMNILFGEYGLCRTKLQSIEIVLLAIRCHCIHKSVAGFMGKKPM